jgi:hypothetical protein
MGPNCWTFDDVKVSGRLELADGFRRMVPCRYKVDVFEDDSRQYLVSNSTRSHISLVSEIRPRFLSIAVLSPGCHKSGP